MDELVALYEKAVSLRNEGKLEEAAAAFLEAIEMAKVSSDPDAAHRAKMFQGMLGAIYVNLKRYDLAKPCFEAIGQTPPKAPTNVLPTGRAIKALQKAGLLSELTPKLKKRIFEDLDISNEDEDMLIPVMMAYYQYGVEDGPPERTDGRVTPLTSRSHHDGFLTYDHRFSNDSNDLAADLCDIIGGAPLFHLIEANFWEKPFVFVLGTADGDKIPLAVEDIDDIIAFFNETLEEKGDLRRIISIETESDFSAWLIVSNETYKDLCKKKVPALVVEATPGVDMDKWLKMKPKVAIPN